MQRMHAACQCWACALLSVAAFSCWGVSARTVSISNGGQLYEALRDQGVSEVYLQHSMQLNQEEWPARTHLERDLTILGSPATYPLVLDVNWLNSKIQLGSGVQLTFQGIFLLSQTFIDHTVFSAPGLSILAPSPEPNNRSAKFERPLVVIRDGGAIYHRCPPLAMVSSYYV